MSRQLFAFTLLTSLVCFFNPPGVCRAQKITVEDDAPATEKADANRRTASKDADENSEAGSVELDPRILIPVWDPQTGLRSMGVRAEEAGAYYEVLAHARDADIQKQKAAARKFLDERIENFRMEYEAQVRELLAKAEKYKSTDAEKFKRLRLGAKDLLVIRTQQYKKYKEDPASFPNFVDLFKNEKLYHGKLVTFHGHIRNLLSYSADKNDFGVTELHEAWIYTEDSRPNPAVIVCTSIPDGMQDAFNKSRVLDQVTVTGYFFKMFAFEDRDPDNKTRVAPMLIAQRLEWRPMDTEPITPQLKGTGLYAGICALAVSAVVLVWWISRRDRQFRVAHLQPASTTSPPDPDQETGDDHIGDDDN